MSTTEAPVTETKFEQWVHSYGVQNLVAAMRKKGLDYAVTFSAVYQYLRGEHEPRPRRARAMVEISGGALTLNDINEHFEIRGRQAQAAASQ